MKVTLPEHDVVLEGIFANETHPTHPVACKTVEGCNGKIEFTIDIHRNADPAECVALIKQLLADIKFHSEGDMFQC